MQIATSKQISNSKQTSNAAEQMMQGAEYREDQGMGQEMYDLFKIGINIAFYAVVAFIVIKAVLNKKSGKKSDKKSDEKE